MFGCLTLRWCCSAALPERWNWVGISYFRGGVPYGALSTGYDIWMVRNHKFYIAEDINGVIVCGLARRACVQRDWLTLPVELSHNRAVLVYDNRGVGESDLPEGPFTLKEMTEDAAAVMADAGIGRAHLFGVSMGGMIAQLLALSQPQLTTSLIIGGSSPGGKNAVPVAVDTFSAFREWETEGADKRLMTAKFLLRYCLLLIELSA